MIKVELKEALFKHPDGRLDGTGGSYLFAKDIEAAAVAQVAGIVGADYLQVTRHKSDGENMGNYYTEIAVLGNEYEPIARLWLIAFQEDGRVLLTEVEGENVKVVSAEVYLSVSFHDSGEMGPKSAEMAAREIMRLAETARGLEWLEAKMIMVEIERFTNDKKKR